MTVIDSYLYFFAAFLKRDHHGNCPKWWQWFIPRYGNWGGPGWSAGCWNPGKTDWEHPVVGGHGGMDWAMREHDKVYQNNGDLDWADERLVEDLARTSVKGVYERAYRRGAMLCFWVWPLIRSLFKGDIMRKILFIIAMILLFAFVAWWAFPELHGSEVPSVTPNDFGGAAEAHWAWQLLIHDYVIGGVEWLLTVGIGSALGWLGFKGTRLAQCVMYIAAGVRAIYQTFVRPAKQLSKDGKLSEADRIKAMEGAIAYAKKLASTKGFDLFKYLSKDVVTTLAELFVRIFKGGKKTEVIVPLSDSPPLPSSVTEGARPA